jgi:MHS family proline/betaine transporter-like MFS transporter
MLSSLVALLFAAGLSPVMGRLSDRIGRRRMMQMSAVLLTVLTIPAYMLAELGTLGSAMASQLLIAVGAVSANVVTSVLITEMFSTDVRYTASGLSYNITYALFGGTAPYLATWLVMTTGNTLGPAMYVTIVAIIALVVASVFIREASGKPLRRFHDDPVKV